MPRCHNCKKAGLWMPRFWNSDIYRREFNSYILCEKCFKQFCEEETAFRIKVTQQMHAPAIDGDTKGTKEREIIREKEVIVKIRCPYCHNLYDETLDKCPHCGGKR